MRHQHRGRREQIAKWAILLALVAFQASAADAPDSPNSPTDARRAALGARIFADARLSADTTTSCASCHQPDRAFTDGRTVAEGNAAKRGPRNTLSLLDVADRRAFAWDGREASLAAQALKPFTDPREHGLRDTKALLALLEADLSYRIAFRDAFGAAPIELSQVGEALTAFLKTLRSGRTAFDRFHAGESAALTAAQRRGHTLFTGSAGCSGCHHVEGTAASFTDGSYHRIGIGLASLADQLEEYAPRVARLDPAKLDAALAATPELAALGRFLATRDPRDIAAYRTPSLRNVALTAPYFHDGSAATLEEAVAQELYYHADRGHASRNITPAEQADLVDFLRALTDDHRVAKRN